MDEHHACDERCQVVLAARGWRDAEARKDVVERYWTHELENVHRLQDQVMAAEARAEDAGSQLGLALEALEAAESERRDAEARAARDRAEFLSACDWGSEQHERAKRAESERDALEDRAKGAEFHLGESETALGNMRVAYGQLLKSGERLISERAALARRVAALEDMLWRVLGVTDPLRDHYGGRLLPAQLAHDARTLLRDGPPATDTEGTDG